MKNHGLALAAALASSILYSLCTAIVAFWPKQALNLSAAVNHLANLDMLAPLVQVTFGNYITGLIVTFISVYLLVALTLAIYKSFLRRDVIILKEEFSRRDY